MKAKYLLLAAAAFGLVAVSLNAANAGTVSIGYSQDGAVITTVAGSGVSDSFSLPAAINTGFFTISSTTGGATQPTLPSPGLLFSGNLTTSSTASAAAHTLDIFITAQGITGPLGNPLPIRSGFTENFLIGGYTITLSSFISSTNALYGGTALASAVFGADGTSIQTTNGNTGAGVYSVTAQYHIALAANTSGAGTSTINLIAVPGPIVGAGLPGLIAACGGLLAFARRRRQRS